MMSAWAHASLQDVHTSMRINFLLSHCFVSVCCSWSFHFGQHLSQLCIQTCINVLQRRSITCNRKVMDGRRSEEAAVGLHAQLRALVVKVVNGAFWTKLLPFIYLQSCIVYRQMHKALSSSRTFAVSNKPDFVFFFCFSSFHVLNCDRAKTSCRLSPKLRSWIGVSRWGRKGKPSLPWSESFPSLQVRPGQRSETRTLVSFCPCIKLPPRWLAAMFQHRPPVVRRAQSSRSIQLFHNPAASSCSWQHYSFRKFKLSWNHSSLSWLLGEF